VPLETDWTIKINLPEYFEESDPPGEQASSHLQACNPLKKWASLYIKIA